MTSFSLPRPVQKLLAALAATLCAAAPAVGQNVIRGTVPGWPGNTAYYAPQTVYQSVPAAGAPVVRAQYAPQQAVTAYYAPASAARIAYAVPAAGSYQISYAGANQPGVSATAYYGGYSAPVQRVAYLPQQVYYAPQTAGAPVTYYRTVVAYQPAAVAPQTCGYAATTCQTSSCASACGSSGCGSSWRPFAWLWRGSSSTCCTKPQTCNYGGCGQTAAPYYVPPASPSIPFVPAPAGAYPAGTIIGPSTSPRIPPPGTRTGAGGLIPSVPANERPALNPGSFGNPPAGNPSFGNPPAGNPASGFGTPAPGFGTPAPGGAFSPGVPTTEYRPVIEDSYSRPAAPTNNAPPILTPPAPSGTQIFGSGYSNERTNLIPANPAPANPSNTITEPGTPGNNPGFISPPSSVQPLRDPHGEDRNQPTQNNRAPQLITPGDRTASNDSRWAVIPAVWPKSSPAANVTVQPVAQTQAPLAPVVAPTQLDDGGWKSAR